MGLQLDELKPHVHGQDVRVEIYGLQQVKTVVSQARPPLTKEAWKLHLGSIYIYI